MTEVLVAGAGPTGLVATIELARRGVKVRVVDKNPRPFHGSRGKGLQPRTLEVFDDLGVVDAVSRLGGPYPPIRVHLGRVPVWRARMGRVLAPTDAVPYPNLLMIPQNRTERVLRERLADLGVAVEFGVELTGFDADDRGVTARLGEESVRVRYLVGADGAHSPIRKALGIDFVGQTREADRMIVADVRLDGIGRDRWHVFLKPPRWRFPVALAPLPNTELFQLMAPLAPDETPEPTAEAIQARLVAAGARAARVREVAWSSVWRANVRMAERFRRGRVFIAGDAAHVHSPAGGQGLNTGVQDAYNLGWKLASVLAGADETLLDSYETERLPVAASVLGLSEQLYGMASGSMVTAAKALKRGAATDQLGIHYRHSALAVGEGAGERAADGFVTTSRGRRQRLFDLYRGPHWTLLAAAEPPRTGSSVRVRRVESTPGGATFTLVRPDGYVGFVGEDAGALREYLAGVTAPESVRP